MQSKRFFSTIAVLLVLLLGLTACSQEQEKKVVTKPLTKEQIMAKVSQQLKKQTKLPVTHYSRKETLMHGQTASEIEYYGDKEYHDRLYDGEEYDDDTYQLPEYQYTRHIYEKGQKKEWQKRAYIRPFQETHFKVRTTTGTVDDLKAATYFSVLESVPDKVQMKENGSMYELELTSTDIISNFKWMAEYLKNNSMVIDQNEIEFQKYHTKIIIDKKTFTVLSIDHEVFFTRKTLNLDNGQEGMKNLDIQTKIKYPNTKKMVVPQEIVVEGDKNDPQKMFEEFMKQNQ
jgi:hypothetical protein